MLTTNLVVEIFLLLMNSVQTVVNNLTIYLKELYVQMYSGLYLELVMQGLSFVGLDPGLVGLSLAYTITLIGMFQYCVRISAEVENLVRRRLK